MILLALLLASAVELSGPERVKGDPASPVKIGLAVDSARIRAAKVTLSADAGTLGQPVELAKDRFEVSFTPPQVAVPTTVTVTANVTDGARASWVVTVDPAVESSEVVSPGTLGIRAPAVLLLGTGATAILRVPGVDGRAPAMTASVGSFSEPVSDGSGGYEIHYTPPESRTPRTAVVAAWSGNDVDALILPLSAIARVNVATNRRAAVTVRVADRSFGPFRSTPGRPLVVPVVVPVGVSECTSVVVDATGRVATETIVLGTPSPREIQILPAPDASSVLVARIGDDGRLDPSVPLALDVSSGTVVEKTTGLASGLSVWNYTPAGDARPGDRIELRARAGDRVAERAVILDPREPTHLTITLDPPAWSAGSSPVRVLVSLHGRGPFEEVPLELVPSAGDLSPTRHAGSQAYAEWTPPEKLPERRHAEITVRRGRESASAALELRPGPFASLSVTVEPNAIRGDGESVAGVRIVARDASGNMAERDAIDLSGEGSFTPLTPEPDGSWLTTYQPRRAMRRTPETITVRAGVAEATATLSVMPEWAPISVGASTGFVSNFGRVSSPFGRVEAHAALPGAPGLGAGLEVGYYRSRTRVSLPELGEKADLALDVVPIILTATYRIRIRSRVDGYVGAGPGAFLARAELRSPSAGTESDDMSTFGASVAAGVESRRGPGRVFMELGYWEARANGVATGRLGGVRAAAGYRHEF